MYRFFAKIIFLFSLFTLASCTSLQSLNTPLTTLPESQRQTAWQNNKKSLQQFKTQNKWTLLARVGIVSDQGSSSSQLDWVTNKNNYKITLDNMLTYGVISIYNKNNQVILNYQDKDYVADNPDELLTQLTKLKLPISQLTYWILGLPSPDYALNKLELNEYGLIKQLQQNKFTIIYDDYSTVTNSNKALPHKIIIKTNGLYIKIMAQSWYI